MSEFNGFTPAEARRFADRWLPAWTGNDPARLVSFYCDDAFYADPAVPGGIHGRAALLGYFTKLLGRFPQWVWTQARATPLERGFLNHWKAEIPIGDRRVVATGVCTVQLREGLIERNEVFFDRTELLATLELLRRLD
jgi:hypothetical protein